MQTHDSRGQKEAFSWHTCLGGEGTVNLFLNYQFPICLFYDPILEAHEQFINFLL